MQITLTGVAASITVAFLPPSDRHFKSNECLSRRFLFRRHLLGSRSRSVGLATDYMRKKISNCTQEVDLPFAHFCRPRTMSMYVGVRRLTLPNSGC